MPILPSWLVVRALAITALISAALTYAYIKGGESAREMHAAYVHDQEMLTANAERRWAADRADLERQIEYARGLARTAASTAENTEADVSRRIDEAVATAHSAPLADDVIARIEKIVSEANRR